ncbi:hypothetical protein QEN19_002437 [Hanseniaspora menglaensis]
MRADTNKNKGNLKNKNAKTPILEGKKKQQKALKSTNAKKHIKNLENNKIINLADEQEDMLPPPQEANDSDEEIAPPVILDNEEDELRKGEEILTGVDVDKEHTILENQKLIKNRKKLKDYQNHRM